MEFFEAAGLFVTAPTSYGALVYEGSVKAGDYYLFSAAGEWISSCEIAKASERRSLLRLDTKHKLDVAEVIWC